MTSAQPGQEQRMDDLVERLRGSFDYDPRAMQDAMLEAADRLILYREARDAAAALVAKLDECAPAIANLSAMQFVRSGEQYSGPSYGEALEALRAVLYRSGG